jgi:YetA-like protein
MDMRHYDTRAHGLDASYEDVQPGFSTPYGVARTSELTLYPSAGLPTKEETVQAAQLSRQPPLLVATPAYLHSVKAFGIWSLPDRSTTGKRWLEDQLEGALAFYEKEVEQRRWYGFWDYGDVMHTYDRVRHVWRYDVGGYAWDNSELVPDMWLWYSFLRTGRASVFRMAEAMTRHTGEVDVYHLGRFAGLGSRHNVRHWGCGSKEVRISQAPLRRFYHYLTTDERAGDLMHEVADADLTMLDLDPMRLAMPISRVPTRQPARTRVGPDWLAFAGNWMTEWERTGNAAYRDRIVAGMDSIAAMRYGLFSGPGVLGYDPKTKGLFDESADAKHTSHLVTIMGGSEVVFELAQSLHHPGWERAWLDYCVKYGAAVDGVGGGSNQQWHARLTAYAAKLKQDPQLAARAWKELLDRGGRPARRAPYAPKTITPPEVLRPVEEVAADTNDTSQWSLNAIQVLELIGDQMPEHSALWDDE